MPTVGGRVTRCAGRPGYEGANIRTWVGFRQFAHLTEEAVLQSFRERGAGPSRLYHRHGLGLEIVDSSLQLPATLDVDDEVTADVVEQRIGRFAVRLSVRRDGRDVCVCKGRVSVLLVIEREASGREPPPAELAEVVVPAVRTVDVADSGADGREVVLPTGADPAAVLVPPGSAAFHHSWRVPYTACHFSDRVQHSAYVRVLEDVVERFLADRGMSVGRLLAERGWIPVVSRVRVRMLADAHLEETVHVTLAVQDVLRSLSWEARMDCHVRRGDRLVPVATARIMHGYAASRGAGAGRLAELDPGTVAALTGRIP